MVALQAVRPWAYGWMSDVQSCLISACIGKYMPPLKQTLPGGCRRSYVSELCRISKILQNCGALSRNYLSICVTVPSRLMDFNHWQQGTELLLFLCLSLKDHLELEFAKEIQHWKHVATGLNTLDFKESHCSTSLLPLLFTGQDSYRTLPEVTVMNYVVLLLVRNGVAIM